MDIKQNIQKLISYLDDEEKHFWENCECSEKVQEAEDFNKCSCEQNKTHVLRDIKAIEDWLNSPSCPLVDSEELEDEDIRKCSECNKEMTEGYCIDNGCDYYCSDECLHKNHSKKEFEEMYDNGNGDSYWTAWEE